MNCTEAQILTAAYLDGELPSAESEAFGSHIAGCPICALNLDEEKELAARLHLMQPLNAPESLKSDVERMIDSRRVFVAPEELKNRISRMVSANLEKRQFRLRLKYVAYAAIIASVFLLAAFLLSSGNLNLQMPDRSIDENDFTRVAVDTHLRRERGQLPLEINSDSPDEISNWFEGKVPFQLQLPKFEITADEPQPYILEGARLVGYKDDYIANVSYRMNGKLISLLVSSEAIELPSGGETVISRDIRFHFESQKGFKVITWAHRGLTYALVSDLEERGERSCLVCHAGSESDLL